MTLFELNNILKESFNLDIYNLNEDDDRLPKEFVEKIHDKLTVTTSLQALIKLIYNKKTKISINEEIIESIQNNLHTIDLEKDNSNLVLSLGNLGFDKTNITYYVVSEEGKIPIGVLREPVKKYKHILTPVQYMAKLENQLNIVLIPNILQVETEKRAIRNRLDARYSVAGDFADPFHSDYFDVIETKVVKEQIRTEDGRVVCKKIDTNNYNGYSKILNPRNINITFDLTNRTITSDIANINDAIIAKAFSIFEKRIVEDVFKYLYKEIINRLGKMEYQQKEIAFANEAIIGHLDKIEHELSNTNLRLWLETYISSEHTYKSREEDRNSLVLENDNAEQKYIEIRERIAKFHIDKSPWEEYERLYNEREEIQDNISINDFKIGVIINLDDSYEQYGKDYTKLKLEIGAFLSTVISILGPSKRSDKLLEKYSEILEEEQSLLKLLENYKEKNKTVPARKQKKLTKPNLDYLDF